MSTANFPSGQWTGFFVYSFFNRRFPMDLVLEFRNGVITGEGNDSVGPFVIAGRYYQQEGECTWSKTYVGRHSVEYTGYREAKGIWGTWKAAGTKGGFHIWPVNDGPPLNENTTDVEEKLPLQIFPERRLQPMTT